MPLAAPYIEVRMAAAIAALAFLTVIVSTNNLVTLIAACIGAGGAVAAARVGLRNSTRLEQLEDKLRERRIVISRQGTETTITDEDLDELEGNNP